MLESAMVTKTTREASGHVENFRRRKRPAVCDVRSAPSSGFTVAASFAGFIAHSSNSQHNRRIVWVELDFGAQALHMHVD